MLECKEKIIIKYFINKVIWIAVIHLNHQAMEVKVKKLEF